jgi:serine/threonine/tyrosine-interacting protein
MSGGLTYPKVEVPPCFLTNPTVLSTWKYGDRYHAQQVVDHVWIGPMSVVRNQQFLVDNNIRVLISLLSPQINQFTSRRVYEQSSEFKWITVSLAEDPSTSNQLAVAQFEKIVALIDEAQHAGIDSLIFCETGNEKSASALAAYLIYSRDMSAVEALQCVQAHRFCIVPNNTATFHLQTFEDLCRSFRQSLAVSSAGSNKRHLNDDQLVEHKRARPDDH